MPSKKLKILVIAPHLVYPIMNGSGILMDRRIKSIVKHVPQVTVMGQDFLEYYHEGTLGERDTWVRDLGSKLMSALKAFVNRSDYRLEKIINRKHHEVIRSLDRRTYDIVYYSFIYSAIEFKHYFEDSSPSHFIETHNDDRKWYRNIEIATRNPLIKKVCRISTESTFEFIEVERDIVKLIALTDEDQKGYAEYVSNTNLLHIPVGIDTLNVEVGPVHKSGKIDLAFIGSLSVRMNVDALELFTGKYLPLLRQSFPKTLRVHVMGSDPSQRVTHLCESENLQLHANLPEDEFTEHLLNMDFTVLPFERTVGAKLKLFTSFSHGIPVLSTPATLAQMEGEIDGRVGCFSEDPKAWGATIEKFQDEHIRLEAKQAIRHFCLENSWEAKNMKLIRAFKESTGG